jgi:hypothetical protein
LPHLALDPIRVFAPPRPHAALEAAEAELPAEPTVPWHSVWIVETGDAAPQIELVMSARKLGFPAPGLNWLHARLAQLAGGTS